MTARVKALGYAVVSSTDLEAWERSVPSCSACRWANGATTG